MTSFLQGTHQPESELEEVPVTTPSLPEIRIDADPTTPEWALVPLYKLTLNGSIEEQQVRFENNQLSVHIRRDGHTPVIQSHPVATPRAARALYKAIYRNGYRPALGIDHGRVKGMKAGAYTEKSIKKWPVYAQPKVGGTRTLCYEIHNTHLSWVGGTPTPIMEAEIKEFFEYLPGGAVLDGVVTSTMQYTLFDIAYESEEGTPFESRCALLIRAFRRYIQDRSPNDDPEDVSAVPVSIRIVPTIVVHSHEEVMDAYEHMITLGYTGIVVKRISHGASPTSKMYIQSLYTQTRVSHILKYDK